MVEEDFVEDSDDTDTDPDYEAADTDYESDCYEPRSRRQSHPKRKENGKKVLFADLLLLMNVLLPTCHLLMKLCLLLSRWLLEPYYY